MATLLERPDIVRSVFVTGLRDAHALEHQALALMDRQIDHLASYPELEERLRAHRIETEQQIKRLEEILDGLDESHSTLKDTALSLTGNLMALGHTIAPDEILKNSFVNFAFENFEAASYKALITIAEVGNFGDAAPLLRQTLREELAMAQFCDETLPAITQKYLRLRSEGETASH
ncbi:ferritin-like domain-containing protein [Sphingomonas cannabina]|uniref:ferritin-like domain-containing protein n=1 Tax=Sphingomonas cannabina TaxID=2899123 RepID=UPI001F2649DD|nr:ferritin-like domain-containing protein [Sphingomonas cannabina]UIJ44849.1 ferritin-like domain-containing protein [Sphingomonas cannabina]